MIRRRAAAPTFDDDDDGYGSKYGKHRNYSHKPWSTYHGGDGRPFSAAVPPRLVTLVVCLMIGVGLYHHQKSKDPTHTHRKANQEHEQKSPGRGKKSITAKRIAAAATSRDRPKVFPLPQSLLSVEEDARLERDEDGIRYHFVFSTDCSAYQHWQSYLLYYTAMKVRQPGHVTRIASGCTDDERRAMEDWFRNDVAFMSQRFHLQLTPHFSDLADADGNTVGDYKYFNKPYGLKYWMENSPQLQYDASTGTFPASIESDVVILVDPDMGLLRPITRDFTDDRETVMTPLRRRLDKILTRTVQKGKPMAQVYGFGAQWSRLDLEKIAGQGTPAAKVSAEDARMYYPAGPPYLATVPDMHNIATYWSRFVPAVHEQYPHLLAEMFAYCVAAAHLHLPHQLISSLMISDVVSNAEGWPLVEKIPPHEVCEFASRVNHTRYAVPNVVHYCQRHAVGSDWFFSKRRIPLDVFECDSPLWEVPPASLAVTFDYHQFPGGTRKELSHKHASYSTFVLCYVYSILNEAGEFFKRNGCPTSTTATHREKTRNLAKMLNKGKH
jgi:hypothetical protein